MSFPRSSRRHDLLGTEAYRDLLARTLATSSRTVKIISAFITTAGLQWVRKTGIKSSVAVTVVTQWSPGDLLSGASDLSSYAFARDQSWNFKLLQNLHAKLLLIDDAYLFVGSSNITAYGLSLVPGGNRELGLCVAPNETELRTVTGLIDEAFDVSDLLYAEIKEWLAKQIRITPTAPLKWPIDIERAMSRSPTRLWVADLPWAAPNDILCPASDAIKSTFVDAIDHDTRLYGAQEPRMLEHAFRASNAYRWLINTLNSEPDQTAFFGRLSHLLHACLLDDPAPFRKDIKTLLENLLQYVTRFASAEVQLDRPNQSMRVRLLSPPR
jgi:PLD-like domain